MEHNSATAKAGNVKKNIKTYLGPIFVVIRFYLKKNHFKTTLGPDKTPWKCFELRMDSFPGNVGKDSSLKKVEMVKEEGGDKRGILPPSGNLALPCQCFHSR